MRQTTCLQLHTVREKRFAAGVTAALLPPLALYAALSLALGAMLAVPNGAAAFCLGCAALCLSALLPKRYARFAQAAFAAGSALCIALFPPVRTGALALANRLFAASEATNAYAYEHFAVSGAGEAFAAGRAALPCAVLLGVLCAIAVRRRALLAVLFLGAAFLEAYFGVTPGTWRNLLLFAAFALPMAYGEDGAGGAALLAAAAALALAVFLLAPRPNAAVEAYSERLRDELGAASMRLTQSVRSEENEISPVRQESRLREENARADDTRQGTAREFEKRTQTEREISLPHRIDYLRAALLGLAAVALLVVPFMPFLLFRRAERRMAERRAAFADSDNAAAIRAMFAHTVDWLCESGLQTENRPLSQCVAAVEALTSSAYAARYAQALPIWQEAAYSRHAMTDEQRRTVRALLNETAAMLYEKADRRTKFRMKYVDGLCGS